ncbi:MAG: type I restriction enzyme HsdR N-terminal domain-containing protein [Bacteroidales bacterium]|nr:type I restriction enzyme HsdR N-terminal domain-containing protein [Bacteroidales bacterium]
MAHKSEIYDPLRRKWVARTPEEEVRQAVIAWLRDKMGFPPVRMASEYGFLYNRRHYRADILVFDRQLQPHLLVECKAPGVKLDAAVVEQVVRYTRVLAVKYVLVTNGSTTHLLRRLGDGSGYEYLSVMPDDLS